MQEYKGKLIFSARAVERFLSVRRAKTRQLPVTNKFVSSHCEINKNSTGFKRHSAEEEVDWKAGSVGRSMD
jgi:hypothetical protein